MQKLGLKISQQVSAARRPRWLTVNKAKAKATLMCAKVALLIARLPRLRRRPGLQSQRCRNEGDKKLAHVNLVRVGRMVTHAKECTARVMPKEVPRKVGNV